MNFIAKIRSKCGQGGGGQDIRKFCGHHTWKLTKAVVWKEEEGDLHPWDRRRGFLKRGPAGSSVFANQKGANLASSSCGWSLRQFGRRCVFDTKTFPNETAATPPQFLYRFYGGQYLFYQKEIGQTL